MSDDRDLIGARWELLTLDELEALGKEYIAALEPHDAYETGRILSLFLEWLRARERELMKPQPKGDDYEAQLASSSE